MTEIQQAENVIFDLKGKLAYAESKLADLQAEPKFYKGQQVLVKLYSEFNQIRGFLRKREEQGGHYFIEGSDSPYTVCTPAPDAVTLPNWITHDGNNRSPVDGGDFVVFDYAQYINKAGTKRGGRLAIDVNWSIVTRYCVIPEYEEL